MNRVFNFHVPKGMEGIYIRLQNELSTEACVTCSLCGGALDQANANNNGNLHVKGCKIEEKLYIYQ